MASTEQSDEEIWQSIRHGTMDELAQEIGRMCLYWSELEMDVSLFLMDLLNIEDVTSKNAVLGALDFRTKLELLLPMAFKRKPSDAWYVEVEKVVNHIANDLRSERNRIIHDSWIEMPGMNDPHRMRLQAKVVNVQARTKKLQLADYKAFTPKDVGLLYVKMIRARKTVSELDRRRRALDKRPDTPPIPRPQTTV